MKKQYIYPIVESQDYTPMHSLCGSAPYVDPDYEGQGSNVAARKLYV